MDTFRLLGLCAVVAACAACAGAPTAADVAPASPAAPSAPAASSTPKSRAAELANAPVYDAAGHATTCAPPQPTCPEVKPDAAFRERCRMAGFQMRQCGCEQLCAGDVTAATRHYSADGTPKECLPARADCTPPQASGAFQDACAEKGFRLDVCGCEWLCSGNPKK